MAEVEPRVEQFEGSEAEALAFVVGENLSRRHLTTKQRTAIALKLATMRQGERTDLSSNEPRSLSQKQAAELMNVSVASVKRAEGGAGKPKKRRKAAPMDLERGSTFTDNDPLDDEEDEQPVIGRDRSVADMSAAADENDEELIEERWQRNLKCIRRRLPRLVPRLEGELGRGRVGAAQTVADLKKAFAALADLATGLGIDLAEIGAE